MNILHRETRNIGDLCAAPASYFPKLLPLASLSSTPTSLDRPLIFGGGGMFYPTIARRMEELIKKHKGPTVLWGVGTNTHSLVNAPYPSWLDRVTLVGLRDAGTPHRWVPCASCLSPAFDQFRKHKANHEIVLYLHHEMGHPSELSQDFPTLKNNAKSLIEVLSFLASGEMIVTNTYHGAYWGTLLGRKVIAYPFSSKFFGYRHAPALVLPGHAWQHLRDHAKTYPDALEECREANQNFFREVRRLL